MNKIASLSKDQLKKKLWEANPEIRALLKKSSDVADARENLFEYLNGLERHYFNIHSEKEYKDFHIIEKTNAKECIRVLKNVIRTENEKIADFSALKVLRDLALNSEPEIPVSESFLAEFIFLFHGVHARSGITDDSFKLPSDNKKASQLRSKKLDEYARRMDDHLRHYRHGLDPAVIHDRKAASKAILEYYQGTEKDWQDYKWQLKHIITTRKTLEKLVMLDEDERLGLEYAERYRIPFQITPYYLSLFNRKGRTKDDRAIRAQVLPSANYCINVDKNRKSGFDMDFMGERSTSPAEAITRRYPHIVILKPVDICPQLCVYCQRNWEVKPMRESKATRNKTAAAIDWIRNNENISEVLVTGGDPLILGDDYIETILQSLSEIGHVERIRIGTRVLVTLPMRIGDSFIRILRKFHRPGKREICIVTHFEHPMEITPEAVSAIGRIRRAGISIYNQQVFTYYNSSRFASCALRKQLKLAGVDPYYTFNTKGKEETSDFRVPIARISQERKEEARFLPGLARTDEPVFNVPKLGKSHLRAWQDHELIMINSQGQRVYRFFPWESKVTLVDDFIYTDVSIYKYLMRLKEDGEDPEEYKSIWYYF
ncbi:MAG TPA: KamA family radical SAM protein [Bacteroidales bacterium]|nr:KamA family radical SAM protein [Bacteroidales bacterium]